jgi:PilZ domain
MLLKMLDHMMHGPNDTWATLETLAISREPIRIEIENSLERFTSPVSISKGAVVFARPERDTLHVSAGDHIRAFLPGKNGRRELRLEVLAAKMRTGHGRLALMCKPSPRIVARRRAADRYNVRRYSNLLLSLEGDQFRVVDISTNGCKVILTPMQTQGKFPLGDTLWYSALKLGATTTMRLEALVPRSHAGRMIGCEFKVRRDDDSAETLQKLIASLDKAQDRRATAG